MSVKKIMGFCLALFLLFISNVKAEENGDELLKRIAPDGKNAVFKMKRPTSQIEGDFNINGYVNNIFRDEGYIIQAACLNAPYEDCIIEFYSKDYETDFSTGNTIKGFKSEYNIKVTYEEPKENSIINSYSLKLNTFDSSNPSTYYMVEDLSLINYYLTSNKSELWNSGAAGRALKYSTINNITKGSNITYYLDIRAGNQDESLMYESAFGPMSIFYNGYSYLTKEEGVYLKRVIYIPKTTKDDANSYVLAAQKRIDDYLGSSSKVKVTYGGKLNDLDEDSEDIDYPIQSDDNNYYNIKVGNRTYKFYIIKASDDKLISPTYVGTDIISNIQITSINSNIPLDTSLTVKNLNDNSIKDKIGTDNYKIYDISLYSDASNSKIEKLDNIGLNEREANEFIMYWLPILEKNNKSLVYFELTQERDKYNKLYVNPKPDAQLRIAIHVKKVNKKINIKPQTFTKFKRSGFTIVEWGGVTY